MCLVAVSVQDLEGDECNLEHHRGCVCDLEQVSTLSDSQSLMCKLRAMSAFESDSLLLRCL